MPEPHNTPLIGTKGYKEKLLDLYKNTRSFGAFIEAVAEKFAIQEWEHRRQKEFVKLNIQFLKEKP